MGFFLLQWLRRAFTNPRAGDTEESFFASEDSEEDDGFRRMTFTFAVIALAAKLSQCDGAASRQEFLAFCELFPLPGEEQDKTQRLFAMACEDSMPASHYARQIMQLFPKRRNLLNELMVRLCRIAVADGPVQLVERQWLEEIAKILSVDKEAIDRTLSPVSLAIITDPYLLLGVTKKASAEEIKRAYRNRIRELHPDTLMAQGYAPQEIALAGGTLASINEAYGLIARKRKIK